MSNFTEACWPKNDQAACSLTVVVPVFNEEAGIVEFHHRLMAALHALQVTHEILYIDDGSTDGTDAQLKAIRCRHTCVSVAKLSRNFGKEAAMTAGLQLAKGQAVVIIDADLQDPPELIGQMLDAWRQGADVVSMRRRSRAGESWVKEASAFAFYRVFNALADVHMPADVGDYRLLSRRVVNAINQLPEQNRFMKGIFAWVGFRSVTIEYDRHARAEGQSKWPYRKLWRFAVEGITGFSVAPLKLATYTGLASSLLSFGYAAHFLIKTLLVGDAVHGFPTLIVSILMLGGLQLMAIGILGEYIGRIFLESKRRPLFLLDEYEQATSLNVEPRPVWLNVPQALAQTSIQAAHEHRVA
jgi:glycosyltransferase involved in cell wall biosynthesis